MINSTSSGRVTARRNCLVLAILPFCYPLSPNQATKVWLRRPFAARPKLVKEALSLLLIVGSRPLGLPLNFDVKIVEGTKLALILVFGSDARIGRSARVARKARRALRPPFEKLDQAGIAENSPHAPQLVVHESVHRIKNERSSWAGSEADGFVCRLLRQFCEYRQQGSSPSYPIRLGDSL